MLNTLRKLLDSMSNILLYIGGAIIAVQAFWITYGVFMRYVLGKPDGMVTEATALMLVPLAFLGLAYALKVDGYPKVTIFVELLRPSIQKVLQRVNFAIMLMIGLFFTLASCKALVKTFSSGSASEILLWPRFYFWCPVTLSLVVFTLMAAIKFIDTFSESESTCSVPPAVNCLSEE